MAAVDTSDEGSHSPGEATVMEVRDEMIASARRQGGRKLKVGCGDFLGAPACNGPNLPNLLQARHGGSGDDGRSSSPGAVTLLEAQDELIVTVLKHEQRKEKVFVGVTHAPSVVALLLYNMCFDAKWLLTSTAVLFFGPISPLVMYSLRPFLCNNCRQSSESSRSSLDLG